MSNHDLTSLLILIIAILLLALCLFFADKLIGDKPDFSGSYYLRAIITAVAIIVIIIAVGAVVGTLGFFGSDQISTILAFVLSCYAIKMLLLKSSGFEKAVWVGVIAWLFVYIINWISEQIGQGNIIEYTV